MWSRPPLKRQGQAENARSWGLRSPPGGTGDFPTTFPGLGAGCEHSVTWGRLGRRMVGRAPKASREPGSPTRFATPLAVLPPQPPAGIPGWPAGGVGAYRCVQGTFPFPGAGAEPSSLSARQGIPLPPAQRSAARPLPTLPRRESGRAGDKETPACLHSPSFHPPETLPGALPRPRRHQARTRRGKGPGDRE